MNSNVNVTTFSIGGVDFQVAFVTKHPITLNNLKSVAGQKGLEIDILGDSDDGDTLSIISRVKEGGTKEQATEFFRFLKKNEKEWVQDHDTVNGNKVLIFYHRETLS